MKSRIRILVLLHIVLLLYIGLNTFVMNRYMNLLYNEQSIIRLGVSSEYEYNLFLDVLSETNITAIRRDEPELNTMVFHTNDVTLNNSVNIIAGRFPVQGEFISNIDTGMPNQSGVFANIIPGYTFYIFNIEARYNLNISSWYHINTADLAVVDYIFSRLYDNIYNIQLVSMMGSLSFFDALIATFLPSLNLIIIFLIMNVFLFMSATISIIHYFSNKSKNAYILMSLGYNKFKVYISLVSKLFDLKFAVQSSLLIYSVFIGYLLLKGNYSHLYLVLSGMFLVFFLTTMFGYWVISLACNLIIIRLSHKSINIVKNTTPYSSLFIMDIGFKSAYVVFFIIAIVIFIPSFNNFFARRSTLNYWDTTRNIYRVFVQDIGQFGNFELEELITEKIKVFHQHLSESGAGFIINTNNFRTMETWGIDEVYPMIHPVYNVQTHLVIDSNYLNVNPIVAIDGTLAIENIVYDYSVLNVLVPYSLAHLEYDLSVFYLDHFYFHKVVVENIYNHDLGRSLNVTTQDELYVNIIFVRDNQSYFTFDPALRISAGNMIIDPIVVIDTGSVHQSHLYSAAINGLFLRTDDLSPMEYIYSILGRSDILGSPISIYALNQESLTRLNQEFYASLFLMITAALMGIGISYNLLSNYYEKNMVKLTIKTLWGYTSIKKNRIFFIMLFVPTIAILVFSLVIFETQALYSVTFLHPRLRTYLPNFGMQAFFGVVFLLALDILFLLTKEKVFQSKTHNKILKGGNL